MKIPDIFIAEKSSLIYASKTNDRIKRKDNQNNLDVKRYFEDHRKKVQSSIDTYNYSVMSQSINNTQKSNK